MINSISSLLQEIMKKEAEKLDREDLQHAPTIGRMYEGLTRDILDRALPENLDLHVVEGFVEGFDGRLSHQVDAMLVTGVGRALPYQSGHVWPIQDVLAVFEVKKNLYGAELKDAFAKLRTISHMSGEYFENLSGGAPDISQAFKAFAMLTGRLPENWKAANALPDELSFIFHTLVSELLAPVRIIVGYHGYVDEFSLRKGLVGFLEENVMSAGFGITSFPNQILCGTNSLLKMNGQPYVVPMQDGWWPVVASSDDAPVRILIELLWTKLTNRFRASMPPEDTLELERLAPLLSGQIKREGERVGWQYRFDAINRETLSKKASVIWQPDEIADHEFSIVTNIANAGELDVRDQDLRDYADQSGFDLNEVINRLVERRVLAWRRENVLCVVEDGTILTMFLPDGKVVSTSEGDMLNLWMEQQLSPKSETRSRTGDDDEA